MNKFENIRIMLRQTQKEVNELENIAINFSEEIERQKTNEDKVIKYLKDNISDYKIIQEVNRILRGE